MEKQQIKQVYETPEVGVYETKIKAVICQSNTERPTDGTPGWNWVN